MVQKEIKNVQFQEKKKSKACSERDKEMRNRPNLYWNKERGTTGTRLCAAKLPTSKMTREFLLLESRNRKSCCSVTPEVQRPSQAHSQTSQSCPCGPGSRFMSKGVMESSSSMVKQSH